MQTLNKWRSKLSFRTGVIIIVLCIIFYGTAIAIPFLHLPKHTRGILLITSLGLAKTTQYIALLIFGQQGIKWLKNKLRGKHNSEIKNEIVQDEIEILNENSSDEERIKNNKSKNY